MGYDFVSIKMQIWIEVVNDKKGETMSGRIQIIVALST